MSILTGPEIEHLFNTRARVHGEPALPYIDVSPWPERGAGPNSLDVHLAPTLLVYDLTHDRYEWVWVDGEHRWLPVLDTRKENPTKAVPFDESGFVFVPGVLYLGCTVERVECHGLVPYIDGRSSLGRLGVAVHKTAGRGDDGWAGPLTLEITVEQPVRMYPGDRIGQLTFHDILGARRPYDGRYAGSTGPVASRMHLTESGR